MDVSMKVTEMTFDGATPVDSYGPGFFRIAGKIIEGAVLILPGSVGPWGGYSDLTEIQTTVDAIDILLVGSGAELGLPPTEFKNTIEALDIGIEVMATPAACRTYNVLLAEDRRVALAVLPV